jgi:hypothetical protein
MVRAISRQLVSLDGLGRQGRLCELLDFVGLGSTRDKGGAQEAYTADTVCLRETSSIHLNTRPSSACKTI